MGLTQVSVVGAGAMGSGIAQVCAAAGLAVILVDADAAALARGRSGIEARLRRNVERGRLTDEAAAATLARIALADSVEAVDGGVVIEAIVEALDAKLALFAALDRRCPPETIFASNTSSLSITRLAAATARPTRVVGMHFFNPPPVMRLVEVVRGLNTSDETVAAITALAERLDKTPLQVEDAPGFVANRVVMPMLNEAMFALMEGVATREAIDGVVSLGFNHPMGPLGLADLIGLDVCLAVMEALHHDMGEDKYRPCPLLRRKVAAGHLGRKAGQGFYDYPPGPPPRAS